MPVTEKNAFALLRAFGMLEFALKRTAGFLTADGDPLGGRRVKAKADWSAVDRAVAALDPKDFIDRVSVVTRTKMLGGARNRPRLQFVQIDATGTWTAHYEESPLPDNEAEALVVAMRRVRNNLFHGGKEDPLQEPHHGDDEEWAVAAHEVASLLLDLLSNAQLKP